MTNNFLPDGYEALKQEKNYWKPSKFPQGDSRFRIVSKPIAGWIDWDEQKKPYRYRPDARPKKSMVPGRNVGRFWTLYVWDYAREDLFVLEITQKGILASLENLARDEAWGDFREYDIRVTKKGQDLSTEYLVTPLPHKPLLQQIKEAVEKTPVHLEALYEGKDPWTNEAPVKVNKETGELFPELAKVSEQQSAILDAYILDDKNLSSRLCSRFKLKKLHDMKAEDFEGAVNWLKVVKEARDAKVGVA